MIAAVTPYQPRPIRFLEQWQPGRWRVKVYTITAGDGPAPAALIDAAKAVLRPHLPNSGLLADPYFVGFMGIHAGADGNFVFVDTWGNQNELTHHVYTSPLDAPATFTYANLTGPTYCVWELALINFEREAWIEHILKKPAAPDLDAYLNTHLNADI